MAWFPRSHGRGELASVARDRRHEFDFVSWPVDFLVESDDGRWRLPHGSKGGLPLLLSLKGDKSLPSTAPDPQTFGCIGRSAELAFDLVIWRFSAVDVT